MPKTPTRISDVEILEPIDIYRDVKYEKSVRSFMNAELRNKTLYLNGKKLAVENVVSSLTTDLLIVALIDFRTSKTNRNIVAFSSTGSVAWTIQEEKNLINSKSSTYTSLNMREGKILAFAAGGFEYEIDPANGKIIGEEFLK